MVDIGAANVAWGAVDAGSGLVVVWDHVEEIGRFAWDAVGEPLRNACGCGKTVWVWYYMDAGHGFDPC